MMQNMLQKVVLEKPDDPLGFMANFFVKTADPDAVDFSNFKKAKEEIAKLEDKLKEKEKEIQNLYLELLGRKDESRPCTTSTVASYSDSLGACSPEPRAPLGSPNQSFKRRSKPAVNEASHGLPELKYILKQQLCQGLESGDLDRSLAKHREREVKSAVKEKLQIGLHSGDLHQILGVCQGEEEAPCLNLELDKASLLFEENVKLRLQAALEEALESGLLDQKLRAHMAAKTQASRKAAREQLKEKLERGLMSGDLEKALKSVSPPLPVQRSSSKKSGFRPRTSVTSVPSNPKPADPSEPTYQKAGSAETVEDMRGVVKGNLFLALENGKLQKALGTPDAQAKTKSPLFDTIGLQKEWRMPRVNRPLPPPKNVETACEMLEQVMDALPKLGAMIEQVLDVVTTKAMPNEQLAQVLPGLVKETLVQLTSGVGDSVKILASTNSTSEELYVSALSG